MLGKEWNYWGLRYVLVRTKKEKVRGEEQSYRDVERKKWSEKFDMEWDIPENIWSSKGVPWGQ